MAFPKRRKSSVSFRLIEKSKGNNVEESPENKFKLQEISITSKSGLIDLLAADFKTKKKSSVEKSIKSEGMIIERDLEESFNVSFFDVKNEESEKSAEKIVEQRVKQVIEKSAGPCLNQTTEKRVEMIAQKCMEQNEEKKETKFDFAKLATAFTPQKNKSLDATSAKQAKENDDTIKTSRANQILDEQELKAQDLQGYKPACNNQDLYAFTNQNLDKNKIENHSEDMRIKTQQNKESRLIQNNYFDESKNYSFYNANNFYAQNELRKSINLSNSLCVSFFADKSMNKICDSIIEQKPIFEDDYSRIISKIIDLYILLQFDKPVINNNEEDVIFHLTKLYFNIKDFNYLNSIKFMQIFKKKGIFINQQKINEICKYFENNNVLQIKSDDDNETGKDLYECKSCLGANKKGTGNANNNSEDNANNKVESKMGPEKYLDEIIFEKNKIIKNLENEIIKNNEENLKINSYLKKENYELKNDLKCKEILLKEIEERKNENIQISVVEEIILKGKELTKNIKEEYKNEILKKEKEVKELKNEKEKLNMKINDLEDAVDGLTEKLRSYKNQLN